MSGVAGHGVIRQLWADDEYVFRLEWKHWFELQDKCDCGPNELLERLINRKWRVQDLSEIVRLGLIGGGMKPIDALKLVIRNVQNRPMLESVGLATLIVSASLVGPMTDTSGEPAVATENANTTELISASSTETGP